MRAARFYDAFEPLRMEDVEPQEPKRDEAQIRVRAAGVCGTELHFMDGLYSPARRPITLGHEVAGEVVAVGSEVEGFIVGDRVVVFYYLFCGHCRWCVRGHQHLCVQLRGLLAFMSDGGFAEYVTVPAHCLVSLPDRISFAMGAPICCSVTTSVHATALSRVEAGETAVIIGVGGVGLSLLQVARLCGARVVAVSRSHAKRQAAMALGAFASASPDEAKRLVEEITEGEGADVVFELVGTSESMPIAIGLLGRRGRLTFIGYSGDSIDIDPLALVVSEQRILSSVGNTYSELETAVGLVARGQLEPVVADVRPLDEVNDGLSRLRGGELVGRLVLTP
jgi:propanol-preferring alcohol dehydrogenase